jgi:hypothetical protein
MTSPSVHPKDCVTSPWERHSLQWAHVGYPLRPCAQDIQVVQGEVDQVSRACKHVHALLLGATIELTSIGWPVNSSLTAVDSSHAMLMRCWRPPAGITSSAIQGLWDQLPLPPKSVDLVLADGSLSVLPGAHGIADVLRQLAIVLGESRRIVTRVFVRPESRETPGEVIDALRQGRIGNFHVFKWRLLMALHDSATEGVLLNTVYRAVDEAIPDRPGLAHELGWSLDSVNTIDAYKNAAWRYFFPTLSQFRELAAEYFLELECHVPTYELGEKCPTLVLSRI